MSTSDPVAGLPIKAQYRYSVDEVSRGMKAHLRYNSGMFKFVPIVGWVMVVCSIGSVIYGRITLVSIIPIVLVGGFFISMNPFVDWQFRRRFRHNPNKDVVVSWTFSQETVISEGEGFNFNFSWNKVYAFVDCRTGFLIYPQKQLFHWIPFSGFRNESEVDCIRQIAKSQVNSYRKVS